MHPVILSVRLDTNRNICSIDNTTPPSAVYGKIFALWQLAGGVKSGWGRPLADEQDLPDGGRCSVFEGGHIHWVGGVAVPTLAEDCNAAHRPTGQAASWNRMVRRHIMPFQQGN